MSIDKDVLRMWADKEAAKQRRIDLEQEMRDACRKGSPRYRRALEFASRVIGTLNKFIPDHCRGSAYAEVMLAAFDADLEIVCVPPSRDAEQAALIEEAAFNGSSPKLIIKE